ncbi:MAG: hypothetical protein DRI79_10660, partial [Chloroflexi bacterium]
MSVDEARLIQQAKKGHLTAFAEIYDRYQPAIYRYLLYQVGDAATAEHLTSEVFISLVGSIDRSPHHSLPDIWNQKPGCTCLPCLGRIIVGRVGLGLVGQPGEPQGLSQAAGRLYRPKKRALP